jgi:hypothetical protein
MRTWSYGVNSIYKKAGIYLEEASWWVFVVDRFVEFLCDFMPSVPLPKIKMRLKDKEDVEFNGGNELTTLWDWYGDLRQVFHCFVHMPLFDFCQKRIGCKHIEIDYNKAKEMFYEEDKEFWDKEMGILDP